MGDSLATTAIWAPSDGVSWGDKLDTRLSALDKRGVKYKPITPAKYTTHSVTEFEHFVPFHKSVESKSSYLG